MRKAAFGLMILAPLSTCPTPVAAQGFPLLCQPGPSMTILVETGQYYRVPPLGSFSGVRITVTFKPAQQPGSLAKPRPGECTWLDRRLDPEEPTNFTFDAPNYDARVLISGDLKILDWGIAKPGPSIEIGPRQVHGDFYCEPEITPNAKHYCFFETLIRQKPFLLIVNNIIGDRGRTLAGSDWRLPTN